MNTIQQTGTNDQNRNGSFASQAHQTAGFDGNIMTTTYHAQPYNLEAVGFFFDGMDDYTAKVDGLTDRYGAPVDEFEIQFIDGSSADAHIFQALGINQSSLESWFEQVVDLEDREKAALAFLVSDLGLNLDDALDKLDDVNLHEGSLLDAATEFFDECYLNDIPAAVHFYIDYDAFARDQSLSGAMSEFDFGGTTYTVTNADAL